MWWDDKTMFCPVNLSCKQKQSGVIRLIENGSFESVLLINHSERLPKSGVTGLNKSDESFSEWAHWISLSGYWINISVIKLHICYHYIQRYPSWNGASWGIMKINSL